METLELEELQELILKLQQKSAFHAGYPLNLSYDYAPLLKLFEFSVLNMGDPFIDSNYGSDSRQFEKKVLAFFADLYRIEPDDFWGYVTSGGTEGNLHGIFLGREMYPDGILYLSEETHYSVMKAARLFRISMVMIRSQANGEIDYTHLEEELQKNRSIPAIINLNIGTTMKGAIDNVDTVLSILEELKIQNHYIHCDAALSGMILPFLPDAPQINFMKQIGSISVSAYKFLGCPIPCGVVLTRKEFISKVGTDIDYIGSKDTTILGARNGHTPIFLWYAIKTKGIPGIVQEIDQCLMNAKYLFHRLSTADYPCLLNQFSNTVVFQNPVETIAKKWQLATQGDWAHIVVMQNVDKSKIDLFFQDMMEFCPLVV
jgi:histidine decarboxylase